MGISTDSDGGGSIEWDSDDGGVDDACPSATSPAASLISPPSPGSGWGRGAASEEAKKGLEISLRAPLVVISKFSNLHNITLGITMGFHHRSHANSRPKGHCHLKPAMGTIAGGARCLAVVAGQLGSPLTSGDNIPSCRKEIENKLVASPDVSWSRPLCHTRRRS